MTDDTTTLGELDEEHILAELLAVLTRRTAATVRVGVGDDAAVLAAHESVVATTDTMVKGVDWRDDWSLPQEVGRKLVAQNVSDLAAMGARPTGLLLTVASEPNLPLRWLLQLGEGVSAAAAEAGTVVVGGDVSAAPGGVVLLGMTAIGDLEGRAPVTRAGARPGDVVAVRGSLGRSGAGLRLLEQGAAREEMTGAAAQLVADHCAPRPPWEAGAEAAAAGATSMIDLSDGLVRDASRVARASGVRLDLQSYLLAVQVAALAEVVGEEAAWADVLGGGEEHSLLATFGPTTRLPHGWLAIGAVAAAHDAESPVTLDGQRVEVTGWDHFDRSTAGREGVAGPGALPGTTKGRSETDRP